MKYATLSPMKRTAGALALQAEEMVDLFPRIFLSVTAVEARVKRSLHPRHSESAPLTHQQHRLLGALQLSGGRMRMRDLARMLGISRATLSVNAKRLIRAGYLAKARDGADERGVHLEIAPKARRAFTAMRRARIGFFEAVFAALPDEKRRRLIDSHRFIIDTFQEVARG
jgi:DNA-binding MarR family transcriptional regulator